MSYGKKKNKLNKHAAEQSKKLSNLEELQSMQFYKNDYIDDNRQGIVGPSPHS